PRPPDSEQGDGARAPSRAFACPSSRSVPYRPASAGASRRRFLAWPGRWGLAVTNLADGVKVHRLFMASRTHQASECSETSEVSGRPADSDLYFPNLFR